jgi:hypothetical protein
VWKRVFEIFKRPYWTRLWIVQELCLAQDVLYICGPEVLSQEDWEFFLDSISYLIQHGHVSNLSLDASNPVCEGLTRVVIGTACVLSRFARRFQRFRNSTKYGIMDSDLEEDSTEDLQEDNEDCLVASGSNFDRSKEKVRSNAIDISSDLQLTVRASGYDQGELARLGVFPLFVSPYHYAILQGSQR